MMAEERGMRVLRSLPPIVTPQSLQPAFEREVIAHHAYQTLTLPDRAIIYRIKHGKSAKQAESDCIRQICSIQVPPPSASAPSASSPPQPATSEGAAPASVPLWARRG